MSASPQFPSGDDAATVAKAAKAAKAAWPAGLRRREEVLAHPQFAEARAHHIRTLSELHLRNDGFPGKLKADTRRMVLIGLILQSHAAAEARDPATWPTLVRLKEGMRSFDMDGTRRIDEVVARLVQTGHIRLDPHPGDRRVRWVRPLEPLYRWYHEWNQCYFEPLQLLFPDPGFAPALRFELPFLQAFLRTVARHLDLPRWVLEENAPFAAYIRHDQATLFFNLLIGLQDAAPGRPLREIDLTQAMKAYGVSRSHLRNLLAIGVEAGLIERAGPRGQFSTPTPEGRTASDQFLADALITTEFNYRHTMRTLEADRPA